MFRNGRACLDEDKLEFLLLDCQVLCSIILTAIPPLRCTQDGHVAIVTVHSLLLCLYGDKSVGFGLLKAKTESLVQLLEEPLAMIGAA